MMMSPMPLFIGPLEEDDDDGGKTSDGGKKDIMAGR